MPGQEVWVQELTGSFCHAKTLCFHSASLNCGVLMNTGKLSWKPDEILGGSLAMDWHPTQGTQWILPVALCYENQDKLWLPGQLDSSEDLNFKLVHWNLMIFIKLFENKMLGQISLIQLICMFNLISLFTIFSLPFMASSWLCPLFLFSSVFPLSPFYPLTPRSNL